eukprot:Clim_evm6s68 gene=Clim_evmTU6s68
MAASGGGPNVPIPLPDGMCSFLYGFYVFRNRAAGVGESPDKEERETSGRAPQNVEYSGAVDVDVLQRVPDDAPDFPMIEKFCFPYRADHKDPESEMFSFVLTSLEGTRTYGYCRFVEVQQSGAMVARSAARAYGTSAGSSHRKPLQQLDCLVCLSPLDWYSFFAQLLEALVNMREMKEYQKSNDVVLTLSHFPRVKRGEQLDIALSNDGRESLLLQCGTSARKLPKIPDHIPLYTLWSSLSGTNLARIFANLLMERRLLFVGSALSQVTACVRACSALLYPLEWQHVFIPILPEDLVDYVTAPMPYVIGIHSSFMPAAMASRLEEDVTIIHLDTREVHDPTDDLHALPADLRQRLLRSLGSGGGGSGNSLHTTAGYEDDLARAFLNFHIACYGDFRRFASVMDSGNGVNDLYMGGDGNGATNDTDQRVPQQDIRKGQTADSLVDIESLIMSRPSGHRQFLAQFLDLQMFQQFVHERLGSDDDLQKTVSISSAPDGDLTGTVTAADRHNNRLHGGRDLFDVYEEAYGEAIRRGELKDRMNQLRADLSERVKRIDTRKARTKLSASLSSTRERILQGKEHFARAYGSGNIGGSNEGSIQSGDMGGSSGGIDYNDTSDIIGTDDIVNKGETGSSNQTAMPKAAEPSAQKPTESKLIEFDDDVNDVIKVDAVQLSSASRDAGLTSPRAPAGMNADLLDLVGGLSLSSSTAATTAAAAQPGSGGDGGGGSFWASQPAATASGVDDPWPGSPRDTSEAVSAADDAWPGETTAPTRSTGTNNFSGMLASGGQGFTSSAAPTTINQRAAYGTGGVSGGTFWQSQPSTRTSRPLSPQPPPRSAAVTQSPARNTTATHGSGGAFAGLDPFGGKASSQEPTRTLTGATAERGTAMRGAAPIPPARPPMAPSRHPVTPSRPKPLQPDGQQQQQSGGNDLSAFDPFR